MGVAIGLHVLQHYASEFWTSHLIRYAELLEARGFDFPTHLLAPLERLLALSWKSKGFRSAALASMLEHTELERLANQVRILRKVPPIMDLVYEIMKLRAVLAKKDHLQKTVQGKRYSTTASNRVCQLISAIP